MSLCASPWLTSRKHVTIQIAFQRSRVEHATLSAQPFGLICGMDPERSYNPHGRNNPPMRTNTYIRRLTQYAFHAERAVTAQVAHLLVTKQAFFHTSTNNLLELAYLNRSSQAQNNTTSQTIWNMIMQKPTLSVAPCNSLAGRS